MKGTVTEKILKEHLVSGDLVPGKEIAIRIDQTLTQDATGTMAYLQFEAMGVPKVRTKLSVSYVDHNTLQSGFENADDHAYLQSVAAKYGIWFSRPGNGICHQVNLERFGRSGWTLLGSDSHTPTGGGIGMISIGAGGLDVAVAMAGGPFYLTCPKVVGIKLTGKRGPWVSAKDVILEVLRRLTVKGGVGKVMEYVGPGIQSLSVPQRATITNMGAELGATTSLFPSDKVARSFLEKQGRADHWREILPDPKPEYEETVEIDLSKLGPMVARPHSPDNVVPIEEVLGTRVHQVAIGSCTNSSYEDLMTVAAMLAGKTVHPNVSLGISPGSKQVHEMIARDSGLEGLIAAGARILESACGPCIGMGFAPPSDGVSIRSFNRNFLGRSGTKNAQVYLASPQVCAAAALAGEFADPRKLGTPPRIPEPKYIINDNMIVPPSEHPEAVEIVRGPNIKPLPVAEELAETISGKVLLKTDDNITTDHIMPAGAKILPLRSNIPAMAEHVFEVIDPAFPKRAKESGGGFIVGGENYGQGSSREHAALAPMYLGIRGVIVKSFARIHRANLINFGILPLEFADPADYDRVSQGDELEIAGARAALKGSNTLSVKNKTQGYTFDVKHNLTDRQIEIMLDGGMLNYTKKGAQRPT